MGRSFAVERWPPGVKKRRVRLEFIQPGKPVQNAYVESFNGRLRDECLNANWFTSLNLMVIAEYPNQIGVFRIQKEGSRPRRASMNRARACFHYPFSPIQGRVSECPMYKTLASAFLLAFLFAARKNKIHK
jgi:transposase InsO family protein